MRRLVDRHAVHVGLEIGAVIEVIAPQQVLVGLAFPAVQRNDQTGYGFEQLSGPIGRGELQFLIADDAFARRRGGSEELETPGRHHDLLKRGRSARRRRVRLRLDVGGQCAVRRR